MSTSPCARVEIKLDKCIEQLSNCKVTKRGCPEAMAAVAQCRGSRVCAEICAEEYNRWSLCHRSMTSIASYTDSNGKTFKNCDSFLSDLAACDEGWRWKL